MSQQVSQFNTRSTFLLAILLHSAREIFLSRMQIIPMEECCAEYRLFLCSQGKQSLTAKDGFVQITVSGRIIVSNHIGKQFFYKNVYRRQPEEGKYCKLKKKKGLKKVSMFPNEILPHNIILHKHERDILRLLRRKHAGKTTGLNFDRCLFWEWKGSDCWPCVCPGCPGSHVLSLH